MEIVIATNNENKVLEYREILEPLNIKCLSLNDLNIHVEIEETGNTFKENSYIKAKTIASLTNKIVLADDSGLIVNAYPDILGVKSHRFLENRPYKEKHLELIRLLQDKKDRSAYFTTVITLMNYQKEPIYFEGIIKGSIAYKIQGNKGFGYDPIFIPEGYHNTFGELGENVKCEISHRARASKKLIEFLKNN